MRVDGRAVAESVYAELAPQYASLGRSPLLGIVVAGENPVIESFVRTKERAASRLGVAMRRVNLPDTASTEEIVRAGSELAADCDAAIMQLPLPSQASVDAALSAIPNEKDVDALNPSVSEGDRRVHAPVALAVVEILRRGGVRIDGARTVVVGAGRLVGAPAAWLLRSLGADVSVFSLEEGSIEDLKEADIVVLGAGNPGFVKPEHLKPGVALVDAGTSELKKKLRGDADPACEEIASLFTPVPGGVGPVAVSMIFRNLLDLVCTAER